MEWDRRRMCVFLLSCMVLLNLYCPPVESLECPADIVFLLDDSTSIWVDPKNWYEMLDFVKRFINVIYRTGPDQARLGILTFSDIAKEAFYLNDYDSAVDLKNAVDKLKWKGGETNIYSAIHMLRTKYLLPSAERRGDRDNATNIAILLTDGQSNVDTQMTHPEAEAARAEGVEFIAVGVTHRVDLLELADITGDEDRVLTVSKFQQLVDLVYEVASRACDLDIIDPISPDLPDLANCQADIVFILDDSTSVLRDKYNWGNMFNFIKDFVGAIAVGPNNTRIAAQTFSDQSSVEFYLDEYNNYNSLIDAFDAIVPSEGDTNIYSALHVMRTQTLSAQRGVRKGVGRIAIIITDGQSNIEAYRTKPEAEAARDDGIMIIAVGVSERVDQRELRMIADKNSALYVMDYSDLVNMVGEVKIKACLRPPPTTTLPTTSTTGTTTETTTTASVATTSTAANTRTSSATTTSTSATTTTTKPRPTVPDTYCAADIVFMLDDSTSITHSDEKNWGRMLRFVQDFVEAVSIGRDLTLVGVLTFHEIAKVQFYLDEYSTSEKLVDAIGELELETGDTSIYAALNLMRTQMFKVGKGARTTAKNIAVLVTDGQPNKDAEKTISEADTARAEGIEIITVGVSRAIDRDQLKAIAVDRDHFMAVMNFEDLKEIVDDVIWYACNPTSPPTTSSTTAPSTTPRPVSTTPLTTTTGPTTTTEQFTYTHCAADIAFLIDESTSISPENWLRMKQFIYDIVNSISIGVNLTRVSALTFQEDAKKHFDLNDYFTTDELVSAFHKIEQRGGDTSIYSALRMMRRDVFVSENGDRVTDINIAILMTDGQPNVDAHKTVTEAEAAKKEGVEIVAVGVSRDVDRAELRRIASGKDSALTVMNFEELVSIVGLVIQRACHLTAIPPVLRRTTTTTAPTSTTVLTTTPKPTTPKPTTLKPTTPIPTTPKPTTPKPTTPKPTTPKPTTPKPTTPITPEPTTPKPTTPKPTTPKPTTPIPTTPKPTTPIPTTPKPTTPKPTTPKPTTPKPTTPIPTTPKPTTPKPTTPIPTTPKPTTPIPTTPKPTTPKPTTPKPTTPKPTTPKPTTPKPTTPKPTTPKPTTPKPTTPKPTTPIPTTPKPTTPKPTTTQPTAESRLGEDCKADIVFILDESTSIVTDPVNWVNMMAFVTAFLREVSLGANHTRVAAITFSDHAEVAFHLNEHFTLDALVEAFEEITITAGDTNIYSALHLMRTTTFHPAYDKRSTVGNFVVVVTDGQANVQAERIMIEAELARSERTQIIAVGITDAVDTTELRRITLNHNNVLDNMDPLALYGLVRKLAQKVCDSPDLVPDISEGCSLDLAFLVDSSGSIKDANKNGEDNWLFIKNFLNEFVDNLEQLNMAGGSATRVAVVRFSSHAHVEFTFVDHDGDRAGMHKAINDIRYDGHKTNTPAAFRVADSIIYQPDTGDRPRSPDVVVVITDGKPEIKRNSFAVKETIDASLRLQSRGVKVFAVGVTNDAVSNPISISTLAGISSDPRQENITYWKTADFKSLMNIISDVPKSACFEAKQRHGFPLD